MATPNTNLPTELISRTRLFPDPPPNATHAPLSIIDATVIRFSPTAATWIYKKTPPLDTLVTSLKETLNAYPQWAGQLHRASYIPRGDHTQRYGRLMLTYGEQADPGIEYVVVSSPNTLHSLHIETGRDGCTVADFPSEELLSYTTPLALHNAVDFEGLPSVVVQVTTFSDGGAAIAVKMAHPIADAQTLLRFTHDWASVNRSILANTPRPSLSPVFDPLLLDRAAAGDIDASRPDPTILLLSGKLPQHRYDLWASAKGCPSFLDFATSIPPTLLPEDVGPMGNILPWSDWDITAPVSRYFIDFEAAELEGIWINASSENSVSHLDALLAHIWGSIIRARGLGQDEPYYLDVTFGLRDRLSPPLPSNYLGSPLTLTKVVVTGRQGNIHRLGEMATSIRSSLKAYDPTSLSALLHEYAFASDSGRIWNAFFGQRNTIVTSWLNLGVREVDFGTGVPMYADAVMPSVDGLIHVMEGVSNQLDESGSKKWYNTPVSVSLHLRTDVMEKVLQDPELRKYRSVPSVGGKGSVVSTLKV